MVAVVSNNSEDAVRRYLERHELSPHVDRISARYDGMDPRFLKPSDHLIRRVLDALNTVPATTALVGDSTTDVDAGRAAGVAVIGYANKPGKVESLAIAGAGTVIGSMFDLAGMVRLLLPDQT